MAEYESEIVSKLKDIVTCAVCLKLLEKPNTFTCLHTFCQPCLDQMKPTNQNEEAGHVCPVCRKFCKREDVRVDTFLLKDMLEVYSIAINETQTRMCSKCKVEKPTHRCLICKDDLCLSCKAFHDQFELLKVHQFVDIKEAKGGLAIDKLIFCKEHKDKPIELYCKTCKISICVICKVIHHDGHPSETTDSALERALPQVQCKKKKIQDSIKQATKNLDDITASRHVVQNEIESTKEKVLKAYEKMQKQLNLEKKELLDQLEKIEKEKKTEYTVVCKQLENKIKERDQTIAWVDGTLSATSGVCLLNKLDGDLGKRINTLADERLLYIKSPIRSIDVEFEVSPKQNLSMVGRLKKVVGKESPDFTSKPKIYEESHLFQFDIKNSKISCDPEAVVTVPKCEATVPFHNFCVINGKLWLVNLMSQYIRIYNTSGALEEEKQLKSVSSPRALIPLSENHVAIAAGSGAAVVNIHRLETTKLTNWKCNSVCVSGSILYAFNFETRHVHSFSYEEESDSWQKKGEIHLVNSTHDKKQDPDQIIVCGNSIYLSLQNANTILRYNLSGKGLNRFTSEKLIVQPRICGKDKVGMILVGNKGDLSFHYLNSEKSEMSTFLNVTVDAGNWIYAAPESESSFWVQCGPRTFQRYVIGK